MTAVTLHTSIVYEGVSYQSTCNLWLEHVFLELTIIEASYITEGPRCVIISNSFSICVNAARDSLFALVSVGLRHRLGQLHLKLVAAQCRLLVVVDQGKERVEHQVVSQVELGAACLLARVDTTVLHPP